MKKIFYILIFVFSFCHVTAQETAKQFLIFKINTALLTKLHNEITETPSSPTTTSLTTHATLGFDLELSFVQQITSLYALTGAYGFGVFSYGYEFYLPRSDVDFNLPFDLSEKFNFYRIIHNRLSFGNRIRILKRNKQMFFLEGTLDIYVLRKGRSKYGISAQVDAPQRVVDLMDSSIGLSPPSIIQPGWNISANYELSIKDNMNITINAYLFSTFNNILDGDYELYTKHGNIRGRLYNKIAGKGVSVGLVQKLFSK